VKVFSTFVSCEGQFFTVNFLPEALEDSEAGEELAVAPPFEIKMRLAFSLHHRFVGNYRQKPTRNPHFMSKESQVHYLSSFYIISTLRRGLSEQPLNPHPPSHSP